MNEKKCPCCGASININATECKYCGEAITVQQPQYQQGPQYQQPQYQQTPQYQQPYYQQSPQYSVPPYSKSKTTAGILAILLGGFGIHKFYLGRIVLGVLYLLFFWTYVPSIIGIIEGIIYLTSNEEKFYFKFVRK